MLTCHFCTTPVALSFCAAQSKHLTMNDTYTSMYTNWAAQKQSKSQTDSSILPICINKHGQYTTPTCPKCAYKISHIFSRGFEIALAEFARNPRKLMYREYFRFYSIWITGGRIIKFKPNFLFFFSGKPVPIMWTHLAETIEAGDTELTLVKPVMWEGGDEIVIASTGDRHKQTQNEVVTITGRICFFLYVPPHTRTGFIFRRIKSLFHHSNWQHIFLISFNGTSKRGVMHYK